MTPSDECREAFEKWYNHSIWPEVFAGGNEALWKAWQAAWNTRAPHTDIVRALKALKSQRPDLCAYTLDKVISIIEQHQPAPDMRLVVAREHLNNGLARVQIFLNNEMDVGGTISVMENDIRNALAAIADKE